MASAEYMQEYRKLYPERVKASVEGWRERNTAKNKESKMSTYYKRTFGLSTKQVLAIIAKQKGVCAICGNAETMVGNGGVVRELCLDHCHATGKIRGAICSACNGVLGYARDNTNTLRAAAIYLENANTGYKIPEALPFQVVSDMLDEISKL